MKRLLISVILLAPLACSDSKDSNKDEVAAPTDTPVVTNYDAVDVTIDASAKSVWVFYGLKDGNLVAMTKDDPWIVGASRYMWQTNTGSSGKFEGGAYVDEQKDFAAIKTCDSTRLKKDEVLTVSGYTASVNVGLTQWFDTATVTPLDMNFVVGRDKECIKLKLLTYNQGLYTAKIQRLK